MFKSFFFCLFCACALVCPRNANAQNDIVGHIVAGYQGWVVQPGDNSPVGKLPGGTGNYHDEWEAYPDLREFPRSEQWLNRNHWANLPNGQPARLFASDRDFTIRKHVQWMKQYGIEVAALQRFGEVATDPVYRDQRNEVTLRLKDACEKQGVNFYINYDAAGSAGKGWGDNWVRSIEEDWEVFARKQKITSSPTYARQGGKPVVGLWAMGTRYNNASTRPEEWLALIQWFQKNGCYVIGGTPTGWLGKGTTRDDVPGFEKVYAACDAINPWVAGTYRTIDEADRYARTNLVPERDWCRKHGIDYIPSVYPGASNFKTDPHGENFVPRQGGRFLWRQFVNLRKQDIRTCFITMFDTFGDATQIAKTAEDASQIPIGRWFVTQNADGVPYSADFYLRLTGDAGKMLKQQTPLRKDVPTRPWGDLMATSFEVNQPKPDGIDMPDTAYNGSPRNIGSFNESTPRPECWIRTGEKSQSGSNALLYSGKAEGGAETYCYYKIFDFSKTPKTITKNTRLYYWIYPESDNSRYVAVDFHFTDGTTLRQSACVDQEGFRLGATVGHGGQIPLGAWSVITSDLGALAGKKIDKVWVAFDRPGATGSYRGYIDDIRLTR